jgi:hypothetical protein
MALRDRPPLLARQAQSSATTSNPTPAAAAKRRDAEALVRQPYRVGTVPQYVRAGSGGGSRAAKKKSRDLGRTWRVVALEVGYLAWPEPRKLYRVAASGDVHLRRASQAGGSYGIRGRDAGGIYCHGATASMPRSTEAPSGAPATAAEPGP